MTPSAPRSASGAQPDRGLARGSRDGRAALDPAVVARLAHLDVRARLVVEGFIAGMHRSPFHGFSVEFAEHRPYMPGDPLKNLDWKVWARSDRLLVKQYTEETNLRCHLLLDLSGSMAFQSPRAALSKLGYAQSLAAALAYLMLQQQDAVGAMLFAERPLRYLPARAVRSHLDEVLKALGSAQPQGLTRLGPALHELAERIRRRGLVVLLSDLMDTPSEVLLGLQHFRHRRHEVVVFHILDPDEVAEMTVQGVADERFLILPHQEVGETVALTRHEDGDAGDIRQVVEPPRHAETLRDGRERGDQFQVAKDDGPLIAQQIAALHGPELRVVEAGLRRKPDFARGPDIQCVQAVIAIRRVGMKLGEQLPAGLDDAALVGKNVSAGERRADLLRNHVRGDGEKDFPAGHDLHGIETDIGVTVPVDPELTGVRLLVDVDDAEGRVLATGFVAERQDLTDRNLARADWAGHEFHIIDTGGLESGRSEALSGAVRKQVLAAIEEAGGSRPAMISPFDTQGS